MSSCLLRAALDKPRGERHELGAVTRALWFFALLAAFVVVGARCLSVFSLALASETESSAAVSQTPHAPADRDEGTGATLGDDADDGVDALIAPSPAVLAVVTAPRAEAATLGVLRQQWALQSHRRGLDRPPRI